MAADRLPSYQETKNGEVFLMMQCALEQGVTNLTIKCNRVGKLEPTYQCDIERYLDSYIIRTYNHKKTVSSIEFWGCIHRIFKSMVATDLYSSGQALYTSPRA